MDNSNKFKVLIFYPNEPMVGVTPSNLAYLSACLKEAGNDVELFDCSLYESVRYEPRPDGEEGLQSQKFRQEKTQDELRTKLGHTKKSPIDDYIKLRETNVHEDFARVVDEYKPDLIAITVVDSTIEFSYDFIESIRGERPPIIMGGVGATFSYEKILKSGYIDYVNAGEGEASLPELCERLKNGEDVSDCKNIYLMGEDGEIIKNPMRPIVDIDELPMPDFTIYEDQRFYRPFMGGVVRMAQMDWDRGCPYQCSYCAAPAILAKNRSEKIGNYYRVKTEDKIFEEMKFLIKKYNLDFLYISSETLLVIKMEKFKRIAERYKKEINLPFWCQSRLDSFTEERTKLLKEMGCQSVSVGLEHGNEEVRRKVLRKQLKNEAVYEGFKTLAKYNIRPTINSMMGLPDETREQVFDTFEINRQISKILNGNHNLNVFTFVPFSGTALRRISIEKGYVDPDAPVSFSFYKESMLDMPSMSKEEITGLEKTAHLYIGLPKSDYPNIEIAEKDTPKGRAMFDILLTKLKKLREEDEGRMKKMGGQTGASREEDHLASPMNEFGGGQRPSY